MTMDVGTVIMDKALALYTQKMDQTARVRSQKEKAQQMKVAPVGHGSIT